MKPGDEYRQHAEECRRQADIATSELEKATWLKMANEWLRLAEPAEKRSQLPN
jgi:hypothetical protein